MNHLKTWWAAHVTIITGVVMFFVPSFTQFIATHPKSFFAGLLALVIGAIKSPPNATA